MHSAPSHSGSRSRDAAALRVEILAQTTPIGVIQVAATERGLWRILLPDDPVEDLIRACVRTDPDATFARLGQATERFEAALAALDAAFAESPMPCRRVPVPAPPSKNGCGPASRVFRARHTAPTVSWHANSSSPAATRAVGQACGANPLPILIPCHRVDRRRRRFSWVLARGST